MPAFSETRWRPWGSGCRLQTLSVLTLPLEVSAVRLLSNCSCRLTTPSAGFLGCFRPRKIGQSAAASSLAARWPSQLPDWELPPLVGLEAKGFAPAGGTSALTVSWAAAEVRGSRTGLGCNTQCL